MNSMYIYAEKHNHKHTAQDKDSTKHVLNAYGAMKVQYKRKKTLKCENIYESIGTMSTTFGQT